MTPQSPSWRLYLLGTDEGCADHRDAKQLQGNENWHRSILTPATPHSRPQLRQESHRLSGFSSLWQCLALLPRARAGACSSPCDSWQSPAKAPSWAESVPWGQDGPFPPLHQGKSHDLPLLHLLTCRGLQAQAVKARGGGSPLQGCPMSRGGGTPGVGGTGDSSPEMCWNHTVCAKELRAVSPTSLPNGSRCTEPLCRDLTVLCGVQAGRENLWRLGHPLHPALDLSKELTSQCFAGWGPGWVSSCHDTFCSQCWFELQWQSLISLPSRLAGSRERAGKERERGVSAGSTASLQKAYRHFINIRCLRARRLHMTMVQGRETQSPPQTPKGRGLMPPALQEAAGKSYSTTCSSCMKHPLQLCAFANASSAAQTWGGRNQGYCQGWVRPSRSSHFPSWLQGIWAGCSVLRPFPARQWARQCPQGAAAGDPACTALLSHLLTHRQATPVLHITPIFFP